MKLTIQQTIDSFGLSKNQLNIIKQKQEPLIQQLNDIELLTFIHDIRLLKFNKSAINKAVDRVSKIIQEYKNSFVSNETVLFRLRQSRGKQGNARKNKNTNFLEKKTRKTKKNSFDEIIF